MTYGTATGPGSTTKTFTQKSAGVPGTAGDAGGYGDGFGEDLAAADLNRDGYADLAVADRSEKVNGKVSAGAVTIMWGAKSGLGTKATRLPVKAKSHLSFGNELETGDFDGDGKADWRSPTASTPSTSTGAVSPGPARRARSPSTPVQARLTPSNPPGSSPERSPRTRPPTCTSSDRATARTR